MSKTKIEHVVSAKSTVTIKGCHPCKDTLAARYQDENYGAGKRVHNSCGKKDAVQYRCTICGVVS